MLALGPLAFAAPWLLSGLAVLPVLWWLLRVTPPAPRRVRFPALRLLLGLTPREETPAQTPLWLILMRMALIALIILALAHPLLNPNATLAGNGPLVLAVDNGWTAARHWDERRAALDRLIDQAEREGRRVVLLGTAPPPRPARSGSSCARSATMRGSWRGRRWAWRPGSIAASRIWRCRASCATAPRRSRSRVRARQARCCCSTSAGAAGRSGSSAASAAPPRSPCSAAPTTSSAPWRPSARCDAATCRPCSRATSPC